MTSDFKQCGILTSADLGEPTQPPFKLRNTKWCWISSLTLVKYSSDQQRPWSDCACAQADLRLCWSNIPHCWKSHIAANLTQLISEGSCKPAQYSQLLRYHLLQSKNNRPESRKIHILVTFLIRYDFIKKKKKKKHQKKPTKQSLYFYNTYFDKMRHSLQFHIFFIHNLKAFKHLRKGWTWRHVQIEDSFQLLNKGIFQRK